MKLNDPVVEIKGVGESLVGKFASVGISTVDDLLRYYPRKYDDYSNVVKINKLSSGPVTIEAQITQVKGRYIRGGLHITEALAQDSSGSIRIVWFNQPYRANAIKAKSMYFISGNFELSYKRWAIMNPSMELASDFPINTARLVPVYRVVRGLTSVAIRKAIKNVLEFSEFEDILPKALVSSYKLMGYKNALMEIHFPTDQARLAKAKWRLGFEEVFCLMLASLLNKQEISSEQALKISFNQKLAKQFVGHLPFELTDSQRQAVWQIYLDIQKTQPMNRLLEGDVGAGKTVVAAMAAVMVIKAGFQAAFMAPTELLARQHAETLRNLLKPLGYGDTVSLLVGGMKQTQKQVAHTHAEKGTAKLLVGTHALIQEKINMHNLGLVIIDEQHRFGVEQRKKLISKAGHAPHVLSMTATPIPRSLALTVYGELDITTLTTKPKNRKPIFTKLVRPSDRLKLYDKIDLELDAGRQMFVVCPLIAESETLTAKSVQNTYDEVKKIFKHRRVGLLHGKMKPEQKQDTMEQFLDNKISILVSTTVIEVGVDVPNASIMLIESPERFGLAQIHQLRGRVGRSDRQGYCYLLLSDSKDPSRRLRAIESTSDGFKLAELDLELRGPGALYGELQHGQLDLRIANLSDVKLLSTAKMAANELMKDSHNLLQYKQLNRRVQRLRNVVHLN